MVICQCRSLRDRPRLVSGSFPVRSLRRGWRVAPVLWAVVLVGLGLVPPARPAVHLPAGEQLQVRAWAAPADEVVLLARLARVLFLPGDEHVDLGPPGGPRPQAPLTPKSSSSV